MGGVDVVFYQDVDGTVPALDWLKELRRREPRAFAKCVVRIGRLAEAGHELRRPEADYLRDGVYESRIRHRRVHYGLLYFFHGRNAAVLAHGLTKKAAVPESDIERALVRKANFERDRERHTYHE